MGPEGYRQPMRSHDMSNENHNTIWFSCKFLEINGECGSGTRARNCHAMIMAQALRSRSRRQCRYLLNPWRIFFQYMERKYTQHFAHTVFSIDIFFTLGKNVIWTNTFYTHDLFTNKRTFLGIQTGSWKGDTYADLHIHVFQTDTVLCFAQSASCTLHTANFVQTQAGSLHGHPVTRQE